MSKRIPTDFVVNSRALYRANPIDRIELIRQRIPAFHMNTVAELLHVSLPKLCDILQLSHATINRKIITGRFLSQEESERILGIILLHGQVQEIMADAGDTSADFNVGMWLSAWLEKPLLALGNSTAGHFMDTAEGRLLVSRLLIQNIAGSYI